MADEKTKIPEDFPDDFDLDTGAGRTMSDEEYIEWYKNWQDQEYDLPSQDSSGAVVDVQALIGDLKFKTQFSDPTIEVTHERETHDHELVNGHTAYRDNGVEFVVQAMGRDAPRINVTAWVTKDQLKKADDLVKKKRVDFVSYRWNGIVVPLSVDVNYSREFHEEHGWIYETTFELLGTDKNATLKDNKSDATVTAGDQSERPEFGRVDEDLVN